MMAAADSLYGAAEPVEEPDRIHRMRKGMAAKINAIKVVPSPASTERSQNGQKAAGRSRRCQQDAAMTRRPSWKPKAWLVG